MTAVAVAVALVFAVMGTSKRVVACQMQGKSQIEQIGANLKGVSSKEMGGVLGSLQEEQEPE